MDMTLAELQEMAARQQQQIEAQQQLLASKVRKKTSFLQMCSVYGIKIIFKN